jgi:hypothetical protein
MRFIGIHFLESTLRRGKAIEQFLGRADSHDTIRWLELRPKSDAIEIWEFVAPDAGDQGHLDIYSFIGADDGKLIATLSAPSEALEYAQKHLGARVERWVNQFVSQEEYRAFIEAGRPVGWPAVGG